MAMYSSIKSTKVGSGPDEDDDEPLLTEENGINCCQPTSEIIQSCNTVDPDVEPNTCQTCPRRRSKTETVEPGSLNVLSAKFESLDYDICENHLLLEEDRTKGYKFIVKKNLARWLIFLLIGTFTALIACFIDISIEELSQIKYKVLKKCILYIK
ncbi:hypothetical protein C0J52_20139 [Blattella germanica]|nr:hypothetical protein C0J52_20139 [Blattella germanica]